MNKWMGQHKFEEMDRMLYVLKYYPEEAFRWGYNFTIWVTACYDIWRMCPK